MIKKITNIKKYNFSILLFSIFFLILASGLNFLFIKAYYDIPYFFEYLFIIASFIASVILIYLTNQCFIILNPLTTFFIFYIIFIFIGSNIHFFNADMKHIEPIVFNLRHNYPLLIGVNLGMVLFCAGAYFANIFRKFKPKYEIEKYKNSNILDNFISLQNNIVIWFIFASILVIVLALIICYGKNLPVFYLFNNLGDSIAINDMRVDLYQNSVFSFFIKIFLGTLLPIVNLIVISWYVSIKNKKLKFFLIFFILFSIFTQIITSHRGFILFYVWLILIFIINTSKKVNIKTIFSFIFFMLFSFLLITYFKFANSASYMGVNAFDLLSTMLLERFCFIHSLGLAFIFENFPKFYNYFHGSTFIGSFIAFVTPGPGDENTNFSIWLAKEMFYGISNIKATSNLPTCFIGEFFANFGIIGVLLSMFSAGFIGQLIYIYFIRQTKTIFKVVILVMFIDYFSRLAIGDCLPNLYDIIFICFPFLIAIRISDNVQKRFFIKKKVILL
jgi:oligosaccharide repeat unit polymerase